VLFGIILAIAGAGSLIYGIVLNNDINAQMNSVIMAGKTNPGTIWIVIGIIAIIVGIIVYLMQKKNSTQ